MSYTTTRPRTATNCINCNKRFTLQPVQYKRRMALTKRGGLCCTSKCSSEYTVKEHLAKTMDITVNELIERSLKHVA